MRRSRVVAIIAAGACMGAGLALVSNTARADEATSACPITYNFRTNYQISKNIRGRNVVHQFYFDGGVFIGLPGTGAGRYNFGDLISNDFLAIAEDAWMDVICTRVVLVVPPHPTPQSVLYITKVRVGAGNLRVFYDIPEETCEDEFESERPPLDAATPADATQTNRADVTTGAAAIDEGDCDGSAATPTGGGEPVEYAGAGGTKVCLWYDRYDANGNLLYSVLDSCWIEYDE